MMNKKEIIQDITARYGSALLTKRQGAAELQVSVTQIDRLRKSGELKSVMVGGTVRIPVSIIADIVAVVS